MVLLTQHQDSLRSGFDPNETILTTTNVTGSTFGKIHEFLVDGSVYAQPLVASNVQLPGQSQALSVLYVATMHNSVYAFDAVNPGYKQLWHQKLGDSIQLPNSAIGPQGIDGNGKPSYKDIAWEVGILSTPVIDTDAGMIFVVATNQDASNNITHTLWKLGLDGSVLGQTQLSGSFGSKTFVSSQQLQRSGLALANNTVYIAFAAYGDQNPWQGWVLGYNADKITATTIPPDYVFCTQPNTDNNGAGIWQAGQGPAVDDSGNLYIMTGNGYNTQSNPNLNSTNPATNEYGCTVLKLNPNLTVGDYFAPMDAIDMSRVDDDLGSGGLLLIPGTNLVVGGGKRHNLYLMDRSNLGRHSTTQDNVLQKFEVEEANDPGSQYTHHIHGSPVYYQGPNGINLFVWPENMEMKQMSLTLPGGATSLAITARSNILDPDKFAGGTAGMPGGFMLVTCNGNPAAANTGVLWANHPYHGDANQAVRSGVLRAFDPENVATELWSSENNFTRDDLGNFAKFCAPTVVNGLVYQATMGGLQQTQKTQQQTNGTPALANQADKVLMLGWTDQNSALNTMISPDGLTWDTASLVTIPTQVSQFQPSLAFDPAGNTYIAWTDKAAQGSGRLNIMQSTDPALKTWTNPTTTNENSISGPALAFGNGKLFVAWTNTDTSKSISIASTTNGGQTWHNKVTLGETTSVRPSLVFNASTSTLVLSWSGQGNDELNFLEYTDLEGFTGGTKTILASQFTPFGFGVDYDATGSPVIAFTRQGSQGFLQTATSETQDISGLATTSTRFRWLFDDNQSSNDGPAVATFLGTVFIAWANAGLVNVAVLNRGSIGLYGLLGDSAAAQSSNSKAKLVVQP